MRRTMNRSGRTLVLTALMLAGAGIAVGSWGVPAAQAQQPQQPAVTVPPIVPDAKMKNVGVIDPQEVLRTRFVLVNRSTEDVRIREFRVACNCTRLIPASRTIPARGAIPIEMTVDLRGDLGRMNKTALIYFQGYDRPIEIGVEGQLQYALQAPQGPIRPMGAVATAQLRSSNGRPVRLLSVHGEKPEIVSQNPPEGERVLVADVRKDYGSRDNLVHAMLVVTDSPEAPLAAIRISSGALSSKEMPFIRMMRELNISHKYFNMGVLTKGEAKTFTTTVFRDDHDAPLVGWIPIEGIEVEVVSVEPDPAQEQWPKAQAVTFTVTSTIDRAGATLSAPLYMATGTREKPTAMNRVWAAGLTADENGDYIEAIESQGPTLITGDGGEEALANLGR